MATRFQTDFYSEANNKYTVIIDDTAFAGTATDFTAYGLKLNYSGHNNERFNPILASDLSVDIEINDSTLDTFVSDLVGASDLRFRIKVNKNDSIYWAGIVKTDSISVEDKPYPYVFNLVATDGIGLLKDIDYNDDGNQYVGDETFLWHIYEILGKIGVDDFWGASEYYVVTLNDWREESLTHSSGVDPFEHTRINHKAFYSVDEDGEKTYKSCYDVLRHICEGWGMRFMLSNGSYYIMQPNVAAYTTAAYIRQFDKSFNETTILSTSLIIWDQTVGEYEEVKAGSKDLFKITSGGYQYFPALNKVRVAYLHNSTDNILRYDDITTTTTIPDIDSNSNTATLAFQCTLNLSPAFTGAFQFHFVKFKIEIEIGGYYLSRPQNINSGNITTGAMEWTTTVSYYEKLFMLPHDFGNYGHIAFTTPPLPASDDLNIILSYVGATTGEEAITSGYTLTWSIDDAYLEIFLNGNTDDQSNITYYTAENDTTGNIAKLEIETIFGGNSHPNSFGRMYVTDDGGSTWTIATQWRRGGSGTYITFQQLLANEIILGQLTPVEKMVSQSFWGEFDAHKTLVRNSKNYLFLGGSLDMKQETWDGDWYYISFSATGTTPTTPQDIKNILLGTGNIGGLINYSAPSNQTPGMALLSTGDQILINKEADPENALITKTTTALVNNTGNEEIFIPIMHPGGLFLDGDSIIVKNQVTGDQQAFITTKTGHASGGDSVLSEYQQNTNYDFQAGSFIIPDPLEQQYNINWGRKKYMKFHMIDYTTSFPTSSSYLTFGNFFRPYGTTNNSSDTNFVDRIAIRYIYFITAQLPSASSSISYTVQMVRGSTPTVVATTTITGLTSKIQVSPEDGEEYMHDDVYWFRVKKNDVSGLTENSGLYLMMEYFNKKWWPLDFNYTVYWYRFEEQYTEISGFLDVWTSGYASMTFSALSATQRPEIIYNSLNGHPGAKWERSGGADYLESGAAGPDTSTIDFTLSIIFDSGDLDATKGHGIFCQADGAGTGRELFWINTSLELESTFGGINLTGPVLTDNTVYIATLTWDGTTQRLYINGALSGTNTPTPEGVPGNYYIGKSKAATNTPYFDGIIYEILMYEEYFEDTKLDLLHGYLANKYNVPLDG